MRSPTRVATAAIVLLAAAAAAAPALVDEALAQSSSPSIEGIDSPGLDGTYGTGRIVNITISFDEPVHVEGIPAIGLATVPERNATYASGSGTSMLSFLYTVQPGDAAAALAYTSLPRSSGGGAAIRDADGNAANMSAPGVAQGVQPPPIRGDIAVDGTKLPVLAAAGSASDGEGTPGIPGTPTFDRLGGARGVAAFELGDVGTFAVVASHGDDAVQLVRIQDDGTLRAVSTLNDTTASDLELDGAMSVDTIDMGGDSGTFAVVASFDDGGVQLVRIHENGTMAAEDQIDDGGGNTLALVGARSVDAFWTAGGRAFALVASEGDHGVQVIRVGSGGTMSTPSRLYLPGLNGASGVSAYRTADGTTQALVPAYLFDGIIHLRLNEAAGSLSAIGAGYTSLLGNFQALGRAGFVSVLDASGGEGVGGADSRLAMVTPYDRHSRVVMLRVYDSGTVEAPGYFTDGQNGLDRLGTPRASDSFTMEGRTYAVVASEGENAVQMIRVHADGTLEGAGSVVDGHGGPNGFAELAGAYGIDAFEMDGRTYAIVASENDNGVQLIRLSPPSVANVTTSLPDGTSGIGLPFNVTVEFDAPVAALGLAPSLMLAFDGGERAAGYLDGNGTNRLVFNYTALPGDGTGRLDYAGPAALTTRGIIVDARGAEGAAAADLELPAPGEPGSLGRTSAVRILDTGMPHVLNVSSPNAGGAYGTGRILDITAVLDRPVTVYGEPRLRLNAGPEAYASYADGNGTDKLHFLYTVMPGDGAARLDYASTGALSLPEGGYVSYGDGRVAADLQLLLPPGSPGSLGAPGSDPIAVIGGPLPILRPNGTALDNSRGYDALQGAIGVDVVEDGGTGGGGAYALVAAGNEPTSGNAGGVQLIRIHPNGTLSPGGLDRNDITQRLFRASEVAAFKMGGLPRALVSAGNSISLYDLGPGGVLSLNSSESSANSAFDRLAGVQGAAVFEAYNGTYAVVVATHFSGNGLQLVRILPNGTLLANGSASDGNGFLLAGPGKVDALGPGDGDAAAAAAAAADTPRVLVTSSGDNAVQLVSIRPDGTLSLNGSATNGTEFALAGASGAAVFGTGDGRTHAVVTSALSDAIQLIRIDPDGTLAAAGSAFNGTADGFDTLGRPQDVAVFEMGGWPYALVTSFDSDGIQLARIDADGGALAAAGSAKDNTGGFEALGNVVGVAVFDAGNLTYALVASQHDHGVQMVRLSPASAAGVSSPAGDGPHPVGKSINITVAFDGRVVLEDPARPPSLLLSLDGRIGEAAYLSGNGTAELIFNYTVRPGDATPPGGALEYAHAGALVSRGAITDLRGGVVDLELPGPRTPGSLSERGIAVDGVQPYAVSVSSPNASGTYAPGDAVHISVNFSKAVNVTGVPMLEIELDGANGNANYTSGSGGKALTFLYTVRAGDEAGGLRYAGTDALSLNDGASIRDAVGNDAISLLPDPAGRVILSDGSPGAIAIDGVGPRVAGVTEASPKGAPYRAGEAIKIAVALDEPAVLSAGFNSSLRLALGEGEDATAWYEWQSDGNRTLVYSYEVQPGDAADPLDYDGPNALSISSGSTMADALDNPSDILGLPGPPGDGRPTLAAAGIRIDTEQPLVDSVSSPNASRTYGIGSEINITVSFNEAVHVTGSPQIELETGPTDRRASYDSGGGSQTLVFVYTVLPNDLTGDLEYTGPGALSLNGGTISDAAGNPAVLRLPDTGSPASLGGSKDITVNATEPPRPEEPAYVVSVFSRDRGGSYYAGSAVNITVAFSRAVDVTGTPLLGLSTAPPRDAEYVAGGAAPSFELAFRYVVQEGDMADRLNYAGPAALSLNGGAITYAGGRAANLELPSVDSARSLRDSGIAIGTAIDTGTPGTDGGGTDGGGTDGGGTGTGDGTTPPPMLPAPTCSLGLGMSTLAVEASPGNYSKAVQQVVKNAGSGAFVRVELEATPWYIDPSSAAPAPGAPSLPASLTVMSTDNQGGPFAPLSASGAPAAVAHGLAGGADYPLWLRINLTAYDRIDGSELVQRIAYTAECAAPPPPPP